jgi:hypothetical protein
LREALAAADHDFIMVEPRSTKPRRKAAPERKSGRSGPRKKARYASIIASGLSVAMVAGILINALALQKARHPAPLFGRHPPAQAAKETADVPIPAPKVTPPPAPVLAPAPSDRAALERLVAGSPGAVTGPAAGVQVAKVEETKPQEAKASDPIAQLLKASQHETRTGAEPSKAVEPERAVTPSKTVLTAQRALVKLGFVLKADGFTGASTKSAIEHYERDRGLPVHGELTPKLLHRLSTESGIAIE